MSKNLNDEYERYAKETAPDLWSRIEEALPEKTQEIRMPGEERKKKTGFWKRYGKFMPVAAAAVFLAIMIPAVYGSIFLGSKNMADNAQMEGIAAGDTGEAEWDTIYSETEEAKPDTIYPETEEAADLVQSPQENNKDMAHVDDGTHSNFPFPEINRTVYREDRLVSAEIKIEKQDCSTDDGVIQVESYFELPVLQEDTEAVRKVNGDLYALFEETQAERREWETLMYGYTYDEPDSNRRSQGYYNTEAFLSYNEDGIINIGFYEEVWAGGVIDRAVYSRAYDLNTGKRLNLAEVLGVKEDKLQETLLEGFRQSAKEEPNNYLWSEMYTPEELSGLLKDYTADDFHFCIGVSGEVDIWFAKYEIGSGADGMQTATVGKVNYGQ